MVTASLTNGTTTFSMEVPASGWLPSKSPTPTTSYSRKSGLVVLPIFGRTGDAGQDAGSHSPEFTLEGLGLQADMGKLDTLTVAPQINLTTGAGKNTLSTRDGSLVADSLAIKSYTTTDVEGSVLLWRYTVNLIRIEGS